MEITREPLGPAGAPGSRPAGAPGSRPAGAPGSRPAGAPGSGPAGAPGSRPAGAPGSGPAGAPGSRPAGAPGSGPAGAPRSGAADVPSSGATITDFRLRQLQARDMLRGDLSQEELERYVEERVLTTTVEKAVAWAQGNSIYPLTFGLACCAIEMMSVVGMRVDIARFGFEAFRASPRQADLLIISGRISIKMAPVIRRIYDQMLEPKWAISMGACCSSTGVFNNYALVPADKFMPVDIHVPGCPPRPEALMHGVLRLRDKIQGNGREGWRYRYDAIGTEELLEGESPARSPSITVARSKDASGA